MSLGSVSHIFTNLVIFVGYARTFYLPPTLEFLILEFDRQVSKWGMAHIISVEFLHRIHELIGFVFRHFSWMLTFLRVLYIRPFSFLFQFWMNHSKTPLCSYLPSLGSFLAVPLSFSYRKLVIFIKSLSLNFRFLSPAVYSSIGLLNCATHSVFSSINNFIFLQHDQ